MLAAMVLCAGYGTRLRPLSDLRAKPLVPVGDRPLVAHVIDRLRAAGAPRIVLNAHHRADDVVGFVREAAPGVDVSRERELLGTAGGVEHAAGMLGAGDIVVWNGDLLPEIDLSALVAHHAAKGAEATLVVRPRPAGEGRVGLDASGRVVRLRDRRFGVEAGGGDFLSVHVVGATLRDRLPRAGCFVADVYLPALARGEFLSAFAVDTPFVDVGTLPAYVEANVAWLGKRGLTSWVGAGGHVDRGVTLRASVVGAGASVTGEGVVERCVVWPGAQATAPLADAVVTGEGVVPIQ